jgi:effector-binding domain-containing protein
MRNRLVLPLAALLVICFVASALSQSGPVKVLRKNTEPRTIALMLHKGPYSDIPKVIESFYAEIEKGGHHICGPLMTVYYNDPTKTPAAELMWDVRIPVTNPGVMKKGNNDELGFGYQDQAYVAYTYHVGPFETVGESYNLLFEWAKTNRYDVAGYITEVHWSPPDAKNPVTEIWLPVNEKTPAERAFR